MIFRLVTSLLILSCVPTALAVEDKDRHDRDDEDRDIQDEGADTEFTCNVLDGKFRDTSGPNAVLRYGYEMEYKKGKSPIYLSNVVTGFIGKDIISTAFEGCKDFDNGRRMQASMTSSSLPSSFFRGESVGSGRSMAAAGNDLIVGFKTTPNIKPIWEVECSEPNPDHDCMVFSGGITIYFPDNKRERRMQNKLKMDFSETIAEEDRAIQDIHDIVKNTIEFSNIPDKVLAIKKLTYKILPVTDEPTGKPSVPPTDKPTVPPTDKPSASPIASPSASPTNPPSFEPSNGPSEAPTFILSEEGTSNRFVPVVEASVETQPSTKVQIGPWAWTLLGISMLVCSIMGGIYIKKRQQNEASRRKQQVEEEEDKEVEEVVLTSRLPTAEMIQPLTTEDGKVELVIDESSKLSRGSSDSEDLC